MSNQNVAIMALPYDILQIIFAMVCKNYSLHDFVEQVLDGAGVNVVRKMSIAMGGLKSLTNKNVLAQVVRTPDAVEFLGGIRENKIHKYICINRYQCERYSKKFPLNKDLNKADYFNLKMMFDLGFIFEEEFDFFFEKLWENRWSYDDCESTSELFY